MKNIDQILQQHLTSLGVESLPAAVQARLREEVCGAVEGVIARKITPKLIARLFAESLLAGPRAGADRGATPPHVQGSGQGVQGVAQPPFANSPPATPQG